MSNLLFSFLKNSLEEAASILGGVSFINGSVTITGIYNQSTFDAETVYGGAIDEKTCSLLVSADNLTGKTVTKGQIWTNGGQKWRVVRIDNGEACSTFYFIGAQ